MRMLVEVCRVQQASFFCGFVYDAATVLLARVLALTHAKAALQTAVNQEGRGA